MSSDSDEEPLNFRDYRGIADEIENYKSNPETAEMFVSGWDDADDGVDIVKNPKGKNYFIISCPYSCLSF